MPLSRRGRLIPKLIALGAAAWFAAWACAPPTALAPPVPMAADQRFEAGGMAAGGATISRNRGAQPDTALNLWAMGRRGRWDFGGSGGLEANLTQELVGHAGFFGRYRAIEHDNFVMSPQLGLGWFYASVALPMAVRLRNDLWFYSAPEVGLRLTGLVQLPVGLSLPLGPSTRLNAELGLQADIPYLSALGYYDGPSVYGGVGLTVRP